ncbi:MAG: hypothetical protein NT062_32100 [Proteobacteria bacterium]|nr:hypothetical protein [Pseudomonadota bacterium]
MRRVVAYHSASNADTTRDQLVRQASAVRQAMQADMMHDALRADVLRAIYAAKDSPGDAKEVIAAVTEHIEIFRKALADEDLRAAGTEVQTNLAKLKPALDAYLAAADKQTRLAFVDLKAAEQAYPEFQKAFEELEPWMEKLGDVTQHESETMQEAAGTSSSHSRIAIFVVVLFGVGLARSVSTTWCGRTSAPSAPRWRASASSSRPRP